MKALRTLKIGPNPPDINSVWLYKGTMKYFNNGTWQEVGGGAVDWSKLPAATTTTLGGVKKATAVADLAAAADLAAVVTKINSLLASLRTAGVITV